MLMISIMSIDWRRSHQRNFIDTLKIPLMHSSKYVRLHQLISIFVKEETSLSSVQCTNSSVYKTCLVCSCEHPGRYFLLIPAVVERKNSVVTIVQNYLKHNRFSS